MKARADSRLLLVLGVAIVEVFLNIGRMIYVDSYTYLRLTRFFLGEGGFVSPFVVMRPMVPLLSSVLTLVSHNIYLSFGLVSGFFWISGAVIAYKTAELIFQEGDLAMAVGLCYTTAPVLLLTGAAVMTDSAGFFFIGLAVYLTLKRERSEGNSHRTYFLDALICSVGLLFRESIIFALFFMFSKRLLKRKGILEFLAALLLVGVIELLYLGLLGFDVSVFFYKYSTSQRMARAGDWSVVSYAASFAIAYVTGVPAPQPYFISVNFWMWAVPTFIYVTFALIGLFSNAGGRGLLLIATFLLPSTLIWPEMSPRFSFLMWPAVVPAMIRGLDSALSKAPLSSQRKRGWCRIFIIMYIIAFAIVNTISILTSRGSLVYNGS